MANPTKKPADSKEQPAHDHTKGECTEECPPAPAPAAAKPAGPDLAKAKAPEPAKAAEPAPAPAAPPAPPAPPTHATYRVWAHGTLQHNGKMYNPGDTLAMPCADGDKIVCLSKV